MAAGDLGKGLAMLLSLATAGSDAQRAQGAAVDPAALRSVVLETSIAFGRAEPARKDRLRFGCRKALYAEPFKSWEASGGGAGGFSAAIVSEHCLLNAAEGAAGAGAGAASCGVTAAGAGADPASMGVGTAPCDCAAPAAMAAEPPLRAEPPPPRAETNAAAGGVPADLSPSVGCSTSGATGLESPVSITCTGGCTFCVQQFPPMPTT